MYVFIYIFIDIWVCICMYIYLCAFRLNRADYSDFPLIVLYKSASSGSENMSYIFDISIKHLFGLS